MKKMKIMFLVILALIIVLESKAQISDQPIPSIELKTIDGATVNIIDYIEPGKITYLTFWATWCSPCKKELDNLIDLYPEWQEQYKVNIIAVSVDDARTISKVKGTVAAKGWEYTILCDPDQNSYSTLGFQSVPQSFLIDQNGIIVSSHTGYKDGDEVQIEAQIKNVSEKNK